jgi:crossover junction endodeoxyribonuclease RusA
MITLRLPLAPSANQLWEQGRGRTFKSKKYKDWLEECGWLIKQQTRDLINGNYIIHIVAVRPDRRRRDLDNLLKATSDLLVKSKIVPDDSLCKALAAEWVEEGDPMTVYIYDHDDEEAQNQWVMLTS